MSRCYPTKIKTRSRSVKWCSVLAFVVDVVNLKYTFEQVAAIIELHSRKQ